MQTHTHTSKPAKLIAASTPASGPGCLFSAFYNYFLQWQQHSGACTLQTLWLCLLPKVPSFPHPWCRSLLGIPTGQEPKLCCCRESWTRGCGAGWDPKAFLFVSGFRLIRVVALEISAYEEMNLFGSNSQTMTDLMGESPLSLSSPF